MDEIQGFIASLYSYEAAVKYSAQLISEMYSPSTPIHINTMQYLFIRRRQFGIDIYIVVRGVGADGLLHLLAEACEILVEILDVHFF